MATIGASVVIQGEVSSQEDLRIDGRVHGQVTVRESALTIGTTANVEADLRGTQVTVLGTVRGNISAADRIELGGSARVTGALSANHVVIADGALFNGRIDMDRRTISAKVAQYRADRARAH